MLCKHRNHGECEECALEAEDGEREAERAEAAQKEGRERAVRWQMISLANHGKSVQRALDAQRLTHLLCLTHKLSPRDIHQEAAKRREKR